MQAEDIRLPDGPGAQRLCVDFRQHIGQTPLHFLRWYCLQQVRSSITSQACTQSISQIAMDWGFTHLGRFAPAYREAFGESPSVTAQRHRVRAPGALKELDGARQLICAIGGRTLRVLVRVRSV